MEKLNNALHELQKINNAYSISNETIEKLLSEIKTEKVCTPVIGKFSSGKSALLNTILNYNNKLLKEDITPETAVPTEIVYSPDQDNIYIVRNNGEHENINDDNFRQLNIDANDVSYVRLNLVNSFLKEIPDVMLVDMPGFESGFEVHNKAIDNYLPRSLAYIITFPADDMIVRSSVGDILKELCLHNMPICIAITKFDKRNDDFDDTFAAMKESLKRFIGEREVTYCITSSYSGDAEELEEFLRSIQEYSQALLAQKFRSAVLSVADTTENYLRTTLKSCGMSESELDEQEEKLNKQFDSLNEQYCNEKDNFENQVSECVEEIKADIHMALKNEESSFVAMVLNNQSINDRINTVVRNAVTISVKKRFIQKVDKYLKHVTNCINSESLGNVHISFNFDIENTNKNIVSTLVAAASFVLAAGPLLGGIITGLVTLINKIRNNKKREELKNQIKMKLNTEVYPQILKDVGYEIEIAITKQIEFINTSIEDEISSQRATIEKSLKDIREKITDENKRKENLTIDIRADLERIQLIRDEYIIPVSVNSSQQYPSHITQ